ncbi:hypothetical protein AM305_04448 [Actinobacillus minor NM305]|uniref:Uncharacterized protein n=1 Tax=Actinobacillus minor NM305 TaxID=637911 RepID=C5RYW1_9PAST|nr:hypothetical protein [Actinobacillus minor]EER48148.1 hypothetical protein AM305_04448 [Actinobacillus minor NM305]
MKIETYTVQQVISNMSDSELSNVLKYMKKIADKQGVAVVMEDDALITTYNLNSYNRKLSKFH